MVPPILPAALTANNALAQRRLEKKDIFCLHSKHIPLCGGIDIVAFDKVRLKLKANFHTYLQLWTFAYVQLLNRPYENEVTLNEHN